jgi:hypothetical protein
MKLSDETVRDILMVTVQHTLNLLDDGLIYEDEDCGVVDIEASDGLLLVAFEAIEKLGRISLASLNIEKQLRADLAEAECNLTTALDRIVQLEKGA